MKDINCVMLGGRLTRNIGDRDYRSLSNGSSVLSFPIAVNRAVKEGDGWRDEPSFIDVTCFGKLADILAESLRRGMRVHVKGELRQERWEAKDGSLKSRIVVVADQVDFERKKSPASELPPQGETGEAYEFEDDLPF